MPLPTAHRVTTAHLQAAYPFMSEGGLGGRGVYIGHDLFGGAFAYDPWELYTSGVLSNPNALVAGVVGKGKALATDTPIPTPSGWTTMGELRPGDQLFDELGRAVDVVAATEILHDRPCYRLTFSDGEQIVADADHLWLTWDYAARHAAARLRKRDQAGRERRQRGTDQQIAAARRLRTDRAVAETLSIAEAAAYVGCGEALVRAPARNLARAATTQRPLGRATPSGRTFIRQAPTATYRRTDLAAALRTWLEAFVNDQRDLRNGPRVRTTAELRDTLWLEKPNGRQRNHAVALCGELDYPKAELPIDAFVLGTWLGDGSSASGRVTCHPDDAWIIDRIRDAGYEVRRNVGYAWSVIGLKVQLRALGVLGDKHVPEAYLRAAPDQRRALLQGLMDTDGTVSTTGQCEFTSVKRPLAAAVLELVVSLGIKATLTEDRATLRGRDCGARYRVRFHTTQRVFSLPRKQARLDAQHEALGRQVRNEFRYVTAVDPVDSVPVRCIQVATPSGLFLAGRGCVPTHNSALVKSYILRQSVFGRRSVVLSPKPGEYDRLAQAMESQPIALYPGGTVRLNPLDPMIAPQDATPSTIAQHREALLVSLAEAAVRRPLEPEEVTATGLALAEARPDTTGVLTLPSVVDALLRPTKAAAESVAVDVETLAHDGRKAGLALRRMVTGDLRGMFDSPTTHGVSLGGPLTVIDLSRMYNSPALGIIMLCANAWQQAAVSRSDGGKWISVSEEAWATLRYTSVARAMQESYKLARSYGVQNIIVVHRLSDLEATGAAGSETRTLAQGLLEDTETRIILNQPPGEIPTAVRLLGLTEAEAALLPTLPRARALWKIADRSFLVDHRLSRDEWPIIDTDARMNVEQGRLSARSPA